MYTYEKSNMDAPGLASSAFLLHRITALQKKIPGEHHCLKPPRRFTIWSDFGGPLNTLAPFLEVNPQLSSYFRPFIGFMTYNL